MDEAGDEEKDDDINDDIDDDNEADDSSPSEVVEGEIFEELEPDVSPLASCRGQIHDSMVKPYAQSRTLLSFSMDDSSWQRNQTGSLADVYPSGHDPQNSQNQEISEITRDDPPPTSQWILVRAIYPE